MYLVLQRPWERRVPTTPSDGPPVVIVNRDVNKPVPKKKRRPSTASPRAADATDDAEDPGPPQVVLSAADRALEWRGEATPTPAQSLDMASGGEARRLEDAEITSTFASQGAPVKACVIQGATNTDLRATITLKLIVDGNGKVTRSRMEAPRYLFERGLEACVQRALGRLKFPSTGAPTLVTMPINLG